MRAGASAYVMQGKDPGPSATTAVDSSTTAKVDDPRAKPIEYPRPGLKHAFPLLRMLAGTSSTTRTRSRPI